MRRSLSLVLAAALLVALVPAVPAHAGHARGGHGGNGFSLGAGFSIGGVHFSLAFGAHGRHYPDYYYRTSHGLDYPRVRCTDRCFRQKKVYFHHAHCPLMRVHLERFRIVPVLLFERYAPAPVWQGRSYHDDYGYYGHGGYDRYDHGGYHDDDYYEDRHERRRYRDRRDRRYRHRHGDACRHDWRHRSY